MQSEAQPQNFEVTASPWTELYQAASEHETSTPTQTDDESNRPTFDALDAMYNQPHA